MKMTTGSRRILSMVLAGVLAVVSGGTCLYSARTLLSGTEELPVAVGAAAAGGLAGETLVRPTIAPPEGGALTDGEEEEDDGPEDTRCIHEFKETWVGYELKLTDYCPDYFPGDEVKITVTFGKKVGSQIGMNRHGSWYTVPGEGRVLETTVIPDNDYLNIQVTDLKELPSVNLADIQIEITKKAEEDNTPYLHRFLGPWEGYETKFSEFNPEYAPGDEVKVSVHFKKDVGSQIGCNLGGEWTSITGEGTDLVKTFLPDNDYLNIQITDMKGNYTVGILGIEVEITKKGDGVPGGGGGSLVPTKYKEPGDYLLYSGGINEGYGTNDGWLLECADTDWLTLRYDCGVSGQENWGVLGWGTSIGGEWVNGPGYSADATDSTREMSLNFSVKYLRRALGITEDTSLGYYSLGAWSEGRIKELTLHVGSEIPRSDVLFSDGAPNEAWNCTDIEQILDLPDDKYICIRYTCATPDFEGWTIAQWGASVNGEWRNGVSYKTSYREATRHHFDCMSMQVFRNMLHLSWENKVDSIKLTTFNDGKIEEIWISDTKISDPGDSKKDKVAKEAGYCNPNSGIYGGGGSHGGGSGSGGSAGSKVFDITEDLDGWGWSNIDLDVQDEILMAIRKGTFITVTYETDGGEAPNLNFKTKYGKGADGIKVDPSFVQDGKVFFSYNAIAEALKGYLIPGEIAQIAVTAGSDDPVTIKTLEVTKADGELADEPIAVLTKNWEGYSTPISKWNSSYQVGDTVTITVTFDKSVNAAIAFTLGGQWSAPYQTSSVIERKVKPESDEMIISLGELKEWQRYAMVKDIRVEVAGKLNYDRAVVSDGDAALIAASTKETAQAAGLTDAMIKAGTQLVITTKDTELENTEEQNAAAAVNAYAAKSGATGITVSDDAVDITLTLKNGGAETEINNTASPMKFKVPAPEGIDVTKNEFAVVRLHDGVATLLPDLDDEDSTVTFASDQFSKFVIIHGPMDCFKVLSGDTSLFTFRDTWGSNDSTFTAAFSEYLESGFKQNLPTALTLVFDRAIKAKVMSKGLGENGEIITEEAQSTIVIPKFNASEDQFQVQIADLNGFGAAKLLAVKVEQDVPARYTFDATHTGYLGSFSKDNPSFVAGYPAKVTLVFDKAVKGGISYTTADGTKSVTAGTAGTRFTATITPSEDSYKVNVDLCGNASAKLLDVIVEQDGVTGLYTFTKTWGQDDNTYQTTFSEHMDMTFETGKPTTVTLVFDKPVSAKLMSQNINPDGTTDDEKGGIITEGNNLRVVQKLVPEEDKLDIQLAGPDSAVPVNLLNVIVEQEVEALYTFDATHTEYRTENGFSDRLASFVPGYDTTVTLTFDRPVQGVITYADAEGKLQPLIAPSVSRTFTTEAFKPGTGEYTVTIPGLSADASAKLLDVKVTQSGYIHAFVKDASDNYGNYDFKLKDYYADYAEGTKVKVTAKLRGNADFRGVLAGNVILSEGSEEYSWKDSGEVSSRADNTATFEWTPVIPKYDGLSVQIWGGTADWICIEELTVEPAPVEEPEKGIHTFKPEKNASGGYDPFELVLNTEEYGYPEYQPGDEVTVTVNLSSDAYFNGILEGNAYDENGESAWRKANDGNKFESDNNQATFTWTTKPSGDSINVSIWWMDEGSTGVTIDSITVAKYEPEPEPTGIHTFSPEKNTSGGYDPFELVLNTEEYGYPEYQPGDEVTVTVNLSSDAYFNGILEGNAYDENGESAWRKANDGNKFESDNNQATFTWTTKPSGDSINVSIWWMDEGSTGVTIDSITVAKYEPEPEPTGIHTFSPEKNTSGGYDPFELVLNTEEYGYPEYQPGDKVTVTVNLSSDAYFNGILEGNAYDENGESAWRKANDGNKFESDNNQATFTWTTKPSGDSINVSIWWMDEGSTGVTIDSITVAKYEPEPEPTGIHTFSPEKNTSGGYDPFELVLNTEKYGYPEYQPGDEVTVTVNLSSDAYFNGILEGNAYDENGATDWRKANDGNSFESDENNQATFTWTTKPSGDSINVSIWWMNEGGTGVTIDSIKVEEYVLEPEPTEIYTFSPEKNTSGGYDPFELVLNTEKYGYPEYQPGDEVTVTVNLSSDAYFNGILEGNAYDENGATDWRKANDGNSFESDENNQATFTWTTKPSGDSINVSIWWMNEGGAGVTIDSVKVELVDATTPIDAILSEDNMNVYTFETPETATIDLTEYCDTDLPIGTGKTVTIRMTLQSDAAFAGSYAKSEEMEAMTASPSNATPSNAEEAGEHPFTSDEDNLAVIEWTTTLDSESIELTIDEMEGEEVVLGYIEVVVDKADAVSLMDVIAGVFGFDSKDESKENVQKDESVPADTTEQLPADKDEQEAVKKEEINDGTPAADPEAPEIPETPAVPDEPEEPTVSDNPEVPDEAVTPEETVTPDETLTPDTPAQPDGSESPDTQTPAAGEDGGNVDQEFPLISKDLDSIDTQDEVDEEPLQ